MPKPRIYYLDKETFSSLKPLSRHSSVLIKIVLKNEKRTTKSGIIVVGDVDFNPAENAQRVGVVEWVPSYLNYRETESETDMELEVGDRVWFDYMTGLNCVRFDVGGDEYKFMNYSDIYVADRDGKKIMLNGNCLFELVDDEVKSELAIKTGKKDVRYGICKYAGKPNKRYEGDKWVDDEEIVEGMKVIFGMPPVMLEDSLHEELEGGGKLRISQRRFLLGFEVDGEVYPTTGHVLIKPDPVDEKTESGIEIPVQFRKKKNVGEVLRVKGAQDLRAGDRIHFHPSSATYVKQGEEDVCLLRYDSLTHKIN